MKQLKYIICVMCAMCGFTACDKDSIDELSGEFSNIAFCNFTNASVQPTDKLGKGIKALNTSFTDAVGNTLTLRFGCGEWTLQPGTYLQTATVSTKNQYSGSVNGAAISEGNIDVSQTGDTYYVVGLVKTSDGKEYKTNYKGSLSFEIGIDDPEPSGYTYTVTMSGVWVMDMTTYNYVNVPGVTKYSFSIKDPNGNAVAAIDAIAAEGTAVKDLAGTYTVTSGASAPFTIDAGYYYPDYNAVGGSNYTDETGGHYISAGTIDIETATGSEGELLLTFIGKNLGSQNTNGTESSDVSFKISYVSEAK